jgi:hypothetical protein
MVDFLSRIAVYLRKDIIVKDATYVVQFDRDARSCASLKLVSEDDDIGWDRLSGIDSERAPLRRTGRGISSDVGAITYLRPKSACRGHDNPGKC